MPNAESIKTHFMRIYFILRKITKRDLTGQINFRERERDREIYIIIVPNMGITLFRSCMLYISLIY